MNTRRLIALAALAVLALPAYGRDAAVGRPGPAEWRDAPAEVYLGDLGGMIERRRIRALVPYSRTFYFIDADGSQRGLSTAFMNAFEDYLNERLGRGHLRVSVEFVPVPRDQLVPWLLAGRGDVIAANMAVTGSQAGRVRFTEPWKHGVREVLVSGPAAGALMIPYELSGRRIMARSGSSHVRSLAGFNRLLESRGLMPAELEQAPEHFEAGDILELVSAGLVEMAIIDDYLARLWSRVLPDLRVHDDIVMREGGELAFAVRLDSLWLKATLDEFLESHRVGTLFGNLALQRYLEDTRWVAGAPSKAELGRLREMASMFRRYGERYDLDWLMLIAQGYQESRLDQSARSSAGAIGVMQLLPGTGRELGVGDITRLENNIHGGARYLRRVIDHHFDEPALDAETRLLFALAAYNAGPARIQRLRREAAEIGLDPDRWFDHVESVAARRIGRETVEYVSNIHRHHAAFRLVAESADRADLPLMAPAAGIALP